jgi:hypothetical protein
MFGVLGVECLSKTERISLASKKVNRDCGVRFSTHVLVGLVFKKAGKNA